MCSRPCGNSPSKAVAATPGASPAKRPKLVAPAVPTIRYLGIDWIGVPLFIRIYAFRRRGGRKPSSIPGCGCSVRGKRVVRRVRDFLGLGRRFTRRVEAVAIRGSSFLALFLAIYLFVFAPSGRLASLLQGCGAPRRRRIYVDGPPPDPRYRNGRSVVLMAAARAEADRVDLPTALGRVLKDLSDESVRLAKEAGRIRRPIRTP